jgi:hypothetical protein
MEVLGHETDRIHMNFHYTDSAGERARSAGEWQGFDLANEFHIYAVDWTPERITWYLNGQEIRQFTNRTYIPSEPMYLIMNLAVGGNWPGAPDEDTRFPSYFEIDYVRIWKPAGDIQLRSVADTFIDAAAPDENFGGERRLVIDGEPERVAFMKFNLDTLSGKNIDSAFLRIRTTGEGIAGSENSQALYLVEEDWREHELTYRNSPAISSDIVGWINKTGANIAYDIPLDVSVIEAHAGDVLSLAMAATGHDGLYIYSREFNPLAPQLIIYLEPEPDSFWEWFRRRFFEVRPD